MAGSPSIFDTHEVRLTMSIRSADEKLFGDLGMAEKAGHATPGKHQDAVGYGQHFGEFG
jgi:hypothetical protein